MNIAVFFPIQIAFLFGWDLEGTVYPIDKTIYYIVGNI